MNDECLIIVMELHLTTGLKWTQVVKSSGKDTSG